MDSNPGARTRRGSRAAIGSWMAAVVATAAPAQRPNVTGRRIIRTVPRSRIVDRRAANSSSLWVIVSCRRAWFEPKITYSEVGSRKSEVGGRRSEVGGRRLEVGGRENPDLFGPPTAHFRPLTSDLSLPTSDLRPPA